MRSARSLLVPAVVSALLVVLPALPASADKISDKQAQAARLQDRIEALGDQAAALGEQYNDAVVQLDQAKKDTQSAQSALDHIETDLGGVRSQISTFALRAYVYADATNGLSSLLTGDSLISGVAQREGYTALALGVNKDAAGQLRAKVQDADYQRAVLRKSEARKETLTKVVAQKQNAVEKAEAEAKDLLQSVKGELAVLVREEQQRRAAAAAAAARAALASAQARAIQGGGTRSAAASPATGNSRSSIVAAVTGGGRSVTGAGRSVPAPSHGAGGAVAAALSQLGVGYRYAAASPGVAFDCSGLVQWAWSQAGVSLPHSSAAMAAMLPHISLAEAQPGDLIFSYSPVSHVGIYLGGGMMVHSPRTGDVVKVSPVGKNMSAVGRVGG